MPRLPESQIPSPDSSIAGKVMEALAIEALANDARNSLTPEQYSEIFGNLNPRPAFKSYPKVGSDRPLRINRKSLDGAVNIFPDTLPRDTKFRIEGGKLRKKNS